MQNHDLVLVRWSDIIQFADWTPSSDKATDCPEFVTVGFLMSEDSTEDTVKLATTLDTSGVGTGVVSFPVGVIKEIVTVGHSQDKGSTRRRKRK